MSFLHPQILYALPLLLIPVIIHLVQWKRYKKQLFTNVDFLKDLEIQSRKSKKIKELLILATRLLALFFLILAFAEPSFSKKKRTATSHKSRQIIYFDNSLSLELPDDQTNLFFKQKMKLINLLKEKEEYTFFSQSETFHKIKGERLKTYIYKKLHLSPSIAKHEVNIQKALFLSGGDSLNEASLIYLSDNQNVLHEKLDKKHFPGKLQVYKQNGLLHDIKNISLDSIIFIGKKNNNLHYKIWISTNHLGEKTPLIIKNGKQILWSKKIEFKDSLNKSFEIVLPGMSPLLAEAKIQDKGFPFDNSLYFTYNNSAKIPVLIIGEKVPEFMKKIFTENEFTRHHKKPGEVDYSSLENYSLIILYRVPLNKISAPAFSSYLNKYGNLAVIPDLSKRFSPQSFKKNLEALNVHLDKLPQIDTSQVVLNKIHFTAPFFKGVFTKSVKNFGYPSISKHLKIKKNNGWLYQLSDHVPLVQKYTRNGNLFLFSSELSDPSFVNDPYLVVPLFYQMGQWEQNYSRPYLVIGEKASWTQKMASTSPEEILKLKLGEQEYIPFQLRNKEHIKLHFNENPQKAGIYALTSKKDTLSFIAFNYNRKENSTDTLIWPKMNNIHSLAEFILQSKEKNRLAANKLWKIFLFLSLMMLLIEMAIIKFWK